MIKAKRQFLKKLFDIIINIYFLFYAGIFFTDYSFLFKKRISNASGFTALFILLLFVRRLIDKEGFQRLFFFKKIRQISRLNDRQILVVLFIMLATVISILGIVRHLSLSTKAWDMGVFDQALWNTLRGDVFFSSIRGNMSLLGDHFEPILFFLLPFYALWPSVFTLIILQSLILSFSIFPLYLIAKNKLNNRFLIFCFIISFIFSRALRGIGLSDFHPDAILLPLSFFAFYFLVKSKNLLFFITLFFLLLCKETAVLIPVALGIYSCAALKRTRLGLILIITGVAAWIIETKFILPKFNIYNDYLFRVRMPFGETYKDNLQFVLAHPVKFLGIILIPEKIKFCLKLLGPLGFFSLFAPSQYSLILVTMSFILLAASRLSGYFLVSSHYVAHVLAFIYISAIYGLGNIIAFVKNNRLPFARLTFQKTGFYFGAYLVIMSLFFYGKTDAYKFTKFSEGIKLNHSFTKLGYLSLIPPGASVSATSNLVPHLSHRKYIYEWKPDSQLNFMTDYIVIDTTFLDYLPEGSGYKIEDFFRETEKKGYKNIFTNQKEDFFIFFNPYTDKTLVENFRGNIL